MNNLILIEGIPGSGKTTTALMLNDYLISKGFRTNLYIESEYHPADLAWNSVLTQSEYNLLLKRYPQFKKELEDNSVKEEKNIIIPYKQLNIDNQEICKYLENKEIYEGKSKLEDFIRVLLKRWDRFARSHRNDEISIFECAFFQNNICELMGYRSKDIYFINSFLSDLINRVKVLNPYIIYLDQESVYETMKKSAKVRLSKNKNELNWINSINKYVEESKYGKKNNLKGFDGTIKFFEDRKKVELNFLRNSNVEYVIIKNENYNWEKNFKLVSNKIDQLFNLENLKDTNKCSQFEEDNYNINSLNKNVEDDFKCVKIKENNKHNENEFYEANRLAWNEATIYHQIYRKNLIKESLKNSKISMMEEFLEKDFQSFLKTIDFKDKIIAHLGCNNGIELISLMELGTYKSVGFDFADIAINEALDNLSYSNQNIKFERMNILNIDSTYFNEFDFVILTKGTLQWFHDLDLLFNISKNLLKDGGDIIIFEKHPLVLINEIEEDNITYFDKGPFTYKNGIDYIGKHKYNSKENFWFNYSISDIQNSLITSKFNITKYLEFSDEKSIYPTSYIINAKK